MDGVRAGFGTPKQLGAVPLGSKLPVHTAQLGADWRHHPVPSLPQSPQSASSLQQPPLPRPARASRRPPLRSTLRIQDPDAVRSWSDQPPLADAPGCEAGAASTLSETVQFA